MPDLAPILASKFDALRNAADNMAGARLYVFEEGTTADRKLIPLEFNVTDPPGLVKRGWRVNPRRFDRFGNAVLEVLIARSKKYPSDKLERIAGFCVLQRRETSGLISKCEPPGIAKLGNEPVWKLSSKGRTQQPFDTATTTERLLEDGVLRLLEDDTPRVLEMV